MTQTPLQPLSPRNAVTAAFRLYRDRFKPYLGIAVRANLWLLLPLVIILPILFLFLSESVNYSLVGLLVLAAIPLGFFGFAKYQANLALISRLAFGTLTDNPETVKEASRQVLPKLWKFFRVALLFWVSFVVAAFIGFLLIVFAVMWPTLYVIEGLTSQNNELVILMLLLVMLAGIVAVIILFFRFVVRFFVSEAALSIEKINAFKTIRRSWKLTRKNGFRVLAANVSAMAIVIQIRLVILSVVGIVEVIVIEFSELNSNSTAYSETSDIVGYIILFAIGVFLSPFWQALKAAVYYDLRSRKEGLDLQLRPNASDVDISHKSVFHSKL